MALSSGDRLGTYEILALLGVGGMGEVYRAHDRKLGREVAIKVLPEEFSQDSERLARFKREAQLLAALNHPNIAAIYGLEESGATLYLVLELVPGETLADRLSNGRLTMEEALRIATQIAEALEEAHEKGIIHRDLKPGNVMITEDGKIRVLDLGLARAFAEDSAEADTSLSPTLTRDGTRAGVILGTASYMSPEQARGKKLDKRSDIFSFGAVLYEMLSGKKAFPGEDVSDILASVIKLEPDWAALPDAIDSRVERLLRRCVEKDRKKRRRDIGDVRNEIEEALAAPDFRPTPRAERGGSERLALFAGVAGLLAGIAATALMLSPSTNHNVTRFSISPEGLTITGRHSLAISRDGRTLAFTKNGQLHLRNMDRLETVALPETDGARSPAFSPDGQWIAFELDGLQKAPVRGGTPVRLCTTARGPHGVTWVGDAIYFADARGIVRVSANGGEPAVVVEPEEGELLYFPQLLPDEGTLLFTVARGGRSNPITISYELDTRERRTLIDGGSDARYVPTGHLVYRAGATLQAVQFDPSELEITGGATTVVENVNAVVGGADRGGAHFTVAENGSLFYVSGAVAENRLVWRDRKGVREPLSTPPALYRGVQLSPDGARLAIALDGDIWLYDIPRGAMSRLTFTADNNFHVWTPDGDAIVFSSRRSGADQVFRQPADGSGEAEQLTTGELARHPDGLSPNGLMLTFHERQPDNQDLCVLEMEGDHEPRPFLRTEFNERNGKVSPDGRWLAYTSDESGEWEVYVRPFPDGGGKTLISTGVDGGGNPVWSADGRELFYRDGDQVMSVPVHLNDELTVDAPTLLFESTFYDPRFAPGVFDVTADGERFVVVESGAKARGELHVVLNWFEELERLVPTN